MSGRPALALGTYGRLRFYDRPDGRTQARTLYRDYDGHTRPVTRIGKNKTAAERLLKEAIRDRQKIAGDQTITSDMRLAQLAELWLARIEASDRAVNTKQQYRKLVDTYLCGPEGKVGRLRISEATVARCDRALRDITTERGRAVGKSCRTVLSGMMGLAARHDAIPANPVRDTEPITGASRPKKGRPRALSRADVENITDRLRTVQRAIDLDVPDLVDYALATGARIGELLACRYATNDAGQPLLDLDAGTWEVNATVVRIKGQGLWIQERTKSEAGWRILELPGYAVDMLRRRAVETRLRGPDGVVFGSPYRRTLRDPSNVAGDIKECLALLGDGYEWVTWHTFRKTVLTWFDIAGLTPREAAAQAGHSHPAMTQNVYYGRDVASSRAAGVLER